MQELSKKEKNRLNRFLDSLLGAELKEIAGGILLVLASIISLTLANSSIGPSYRDFWSTPVAISFGDNSLSLSIRHWINDGLMTIFFFVVGLEIKRELSVGALSSFKKAAMPIIAAIGGMLVPALVYYKLNLNSEKALAGWAIPTATDIAFVVGILTLFSKKTSAAMLVFLLTLATADDLGAIIIIALFYTSTIQTTYLLLAAIAIALLFYLKSLKVYHTLPYIITGSFLWFFLLKSGVNADISGVITAFSIPVFSNTQTSNFVDKLNKLTHQFLLHHCDTNDKQYTRSSKQQEILYLLRKEHDLVHAPSQRLIFSLQSYCSFFIVPLYALTNTAIAVDIHQVKELFQSNISLGIVLGLIVGKPIGIILFTLIASKLKLAKLPEGLAYKDLIIVGCLGGIGFTMSLFVADLAFPRGSSLINLSKLSVLLASSLSILISVALILMQPSDQKHLHHHRKSDDIS
ncbi:MAG: Na+/H+ antiporter NhaA [Chlamydiales bacterium]|nr:Na+/H+ antiporter NhaA [Chlamydiales bacterium]